MVVSDLFYKALQESEIASYFKQIDFAVLDRSMDKYNYKMFEKNFESYENVDV